MIYSKNKENNIYITLSEASKISGVSRDYLNVLIHREKLRAVKIGKNWLTTKMWLLECKMPNHIEQNQGSEYLSLFNAAKIANVSSGYLNVAVRRGRLQAVKLGRNWFTTSEWLSDYQKSVGRGISAIAEFRSPTPVVDSATITTGRASEDLEVGLQEISKYRDLEKEEKQEFLGLKTKLVFEKGLAEVLERIESKIENISTKSDLRIPSEVRLQDPSKSDFKIKEVLKYRDFALTQQIPLSPRKLRIDEKSKILETVNRNFKLSDTKDFVEASKKFGILKSLSSWSNVKLSFASGFLIILLAVTIGFTDLDISKFKSLNVSTFQSLNVSDNLKASIFSDVFKNFPSDLPLFSHWLKDIVFSLFKSQPLSDLAIDSLEPGTSKIVKTPQAPEIKTLAEAESLDAPFEALAEKGSPTGLATQTEPSSPSTSLISSTLESRLLSIEDQLSLQNADLQLQKKTILGTLETLIGISKLIPSHPISTVVVQGQPATLTTYSVSPSVHSGFDRISASYLNLSNNAEINGSLTVKSGGDFNSLGVSGNTTLTGNATIGGTLSVTGDTTLSNLTLSGNVTAASSNFSLNNASSTNLTVSGNAWIGNLAVTGTATSTFAGPLSIAGSLTANGKTLTISSTSTVSSQFTTTGVPIGAHTFSSWATDVSNSNVTSASMVINPSSASADTNLFGLAVNGNVKALIDAEGDLFINSITTAGGVTLSTTTASTFTVENNTTLGDATNDTLTVNARVASDLIPATDNLYRIGTSSLRWLSLDANNIIASSTLAVATTTIPANYGVNIATSTNIFGSLRVGTSSLTLNSGNIINDNGNFNIVNKANSNLTFSTNNSERMRIDNSGNVGIGTTSPGQLLSVNGNGFFAGNLNVASSTTMLNASSTHFSVSGSTFLGNATTTGLSVNGGTLLNSLSFGAATGTSLTVTGGASFASLTMSATSTMNGFNLCTSANGICASNLTGTTGQLAYFSGTNTAVGTSTIFISTNGNVGISTTTPTNPLTVQGNANIFGKLTVGTSSLQLLSGNIISDSGQFNITNAANTALTFSTNNLERMRIDSSGNVGIGTTSPNNLLTISGATTPAISLTTNTGNSGWVFGIDTADANKFKIASSTSSLTSNTRLTIDGNGNVGIGTTSPAQVFSVSGTSYFAGDVGIGTAAPSYKLHVPGTVSGTTTVAFLADTLTNSWTQVLMGYKDGPTRVYIKSDGNSLSIRAGGQPEAFFFNDTNFSLSNGALCVDNDGTTCPASPTAGRLYSINATVLTDDLAEYMRSSQKLEPGDIVVPDPDFVNDITPEYEQLRRSNDLGTKAGLYDLGVKKSEKQYQENIVGIVSTKPGITLGGFEPTEKDYEIALAGRVPLKISTENGPIKIGDRITSSSLAGVGMKATKDGVTVGIALQDFDGSTATTSVAVNGQEVKTGKILVFVNLGYSKLDDSVAQGTGDLASMTTASGNLNMNSFSLLNVKSITGMNGLWKIDESGNITAQSVETQRLTVGGGVSSGVTVYDRQTTAPKCIYIEGGVIKTSDGACGTTANAGTEAVIQQAADTPTPVVDSSAITTGQVSETLGSTTLTTSPVATSSVSEITIVETATTTEPILTSTSTTP